MTTTTTERNDDCRRTQRRKNNTGGVRTEAMARGKRKGIADIIGEEIDGQEKKKKEPQQKMKIRSEGKKMADEFNNKGKIPNGFLKILNLQDFDEKKNIKAVTLANGNFCVVRVGELIYVCDCNSTAYKYPLIDGELFNGPGGASIRSPFDGTSYDLTTGKVIEWCPQDTLPRKMLGKLKENATPVDLGVYPVIVDEQGDIGYGEHIIYAFNHMTKEQIIAYVKGKGKGKYNSWKRKGGQGNKKGNDDGKGGTYGT